MMSPKREKIWAGSKVPSEPAIHLNLSESESSEFSNPAGIKKVSNCFMAVL